MQQKFFQALSRLTKKTRLSFAREAPVSVETLPHECPERAPDGMPIPSAKLITLVAGTSDIPWFLEGGRRGAESIIEILEHNGVSFVDLQTILDFGCGCGRIIRHFKSRTNARFYGTDYNAELVHWCKQHLTFAQFVTNDLQPPFRHANHTFDLVYALSVFTHLPHALQLRWMKELSRVLRPGGYLLLTTHGEAYLDIMSAEEQRQFRAGELVTRSDDQAGTNTCATFHPPVYVREILARDLNVIDFVAEGAKGNPRQDAFLLRKA